MLAGLDVAGIRVVDFQQAVEQQLRVDPPLHGAQIAFEDAALGGERGEPHRMQALGGAPADLHHRIHGNQEQRPARGDAEAVRDAVQIADEAGSLFSFQHDDQRMWQQVEKRLD